MTDSYPFSSPGQKRVASLDGARGVAIALVVSFNYFAAFYQPNPDANVVLTHLDHLFEAGWSGVDLFFVLSGFLIGGVLMDHRNARNYYRTFYVRRAYRILPLYAVILAPLFMAPLLSPWMPGISEHLSSGDIAPIWHLFFLQNIVMALVGSFGERWIATTWSLALEEQFYVLAPPFFRRQRATTLVRLSAIGVVCMPFFRTILLFTFPVRYAVVACYALLRWDGLLMGILAAHCVRRPELVSRLRRNKSECSWTLICLSIATFILVWYAPAFDSIIMSTVGYTLISLLFACALIYCLLFRSLLRTFLECRLLGWLGVLSYGVYLFHEPVISFVFEILFSRERSIGNSIDVGLALLALAMTLTLATISWRFFEKPLLRRGQRHRYAIDFAETERR